MSFSKLYKDLLTSEWLITPEEAMAKRIIAVQILSGKTNLPLAEKINAPQISPQIAKFISSEINIESSDMNQGGNIFRNYPEGSVAIIKFSGLMTKYDTCESYGTETVAYYLQQAMDSNNIIGIVLCIDSGGGAVNSIAPITEVIKIRNKPVIALCDVAASAAYYVACHCDYIIASNTISSAFGSIGVVATFYDFKEYFEKAGIKEHIVYAPESDYKSLPFENALKGDYTLLEEEILSPMAKNFMSTVKANRKNLKLDEPGIISGKMFFAKDALKVGLIDSIGNIQAAIKQVQKIATIRNFINN